jgi:hypothetical protein
MHDILELLPEPAGARTNIIFFMVCCLYYITGIYCNYLINYIMPNQVEKKTIQSKRNFQRLLP